MVHSALTPTTTGSTVPVTWADGHGVWHASVPTTHNTARDEEIARDVIVAELLIRERKTGEPVLSALDRIESATALELVSSDPDGTSTYREAPTHA